MSRYVAWRLFQIVPMLWAVGTALFVLLHLTPGGPIVALTGEFAEPHPELTFQKFITPLLGHVASICKSQ